MLESLLLKLGNPNWKQEKIETLIPINNYENYNGPSLRPSMSSTLARM